MKKNIQKLNLSIKSNFSLAISLDICFKNDNNKKPIVIFCHGFKGFKDWGAWNMVANTFAENNFIFIKFNFSHNGITENNLLDFENLNAFSENNYSKELDDLQKVIDWTNSDNFPINKNEYDEKKIFLIGHSRGGGAVIIKNLEEYRVKKISTWASIDTYDRFGTTKQIEKWKLNGEHIFINGRTGQKMPIKYKFYEDYSKNKNRLNIKGALQKSKKPILVVHGTEDTAVSIKSAENIADWAKNAKLLKIKGADHVFNSSHPFLENKLTNNLEKVVNETISFFADVK